jgi:CelD/BcsL family acetyltransferase involved in cellulose biosynthesis
MRACRARGVAEYDFLAPAARYKEELTTRSDQLVWAEVARPTWRTRLAGAIRGVRGTR